MSARIFICYRRTDGTEVANWLHEGLRRANPQFGFYFDTNSAAVQDWTELHQQELARATVLLLVVTPGLLASFGAKDWVHRELTWWIKNRGTAPIVVETTGEGDRWIPARVRKRWPNIQRVEVPTVPRIEVRTGVGEQLIQRIVQGFEANQDRHDVKAMSAERNGVRVWLSALAGAALLVALVLAVREFQRKSRELSDAHETVRRLKERERARLPEAQAVELEKVRKEEPERFRKEESKLWPNGETLMVRFLDGATRQRSNAKQAFDEWLKYANLRMQVTSSQNAQIHVTFARPGESYSYIGTDALGASAADPTMVLGYEEPGAPIPRNYLHEVGHALGLVHETSNPAAHLKWNKDAVYRALMGPPNAWTEQQVNENLFTPEPYPGERPFDRDSIMLNQMPASYFADGIPLGSRNVLSESDKEFIASLYPGR